MREFLPLFAFLPIFGLGLVSAIAGLRLEEARGRKERIASVAIVLGPILAFCCVIYMAFYLSLR